MQQCYKEDNDWVMAALMALVVSALRLGVFICCGQVLTFEMNGMQCNLRRIECAALLSTPILGTACLDLANLTRGKTCGSP